MSRDDKDSLVEMLAKIPVTETRGSLLTALGKLLRVLDVSENAIMMPTLLKDKCEFDAYEMLTLAKILKASILGHNDLVEFYMSESSSQIITLTHNQHKQSSLSATPSLRSSISDSNSSSPSTPQPRTNTIGVQNQLQLNNGDPDTTVRLLLQIEQLKIFIPQVTGLFESIIELYKNSVDTIT